MEMTRDDLLSALRRVGLVGAVGSGLFDNILTPGGGTDYSGDITALQNKDVEQDQRITAVENRPVATDYSPQITALQNKDTAQDTRLTDAEASLLNKASLVAGKVPYEQLPEFPVGRKVNVANKAARLALSSYTDLTIAYESDTGDAWGLDANDDPAIDANWSKLGNSQGIGVASFNGRTGNIGPMAGDYDTGKISELVDKRFVSSDQIAEWNAKETTTGAQTKATTAQTNAVATAKTYVDNTFIPLTQKGANSGVAPLDTNSRVPLANLPTFLPQTKRVWRDAKASRTVGTWVTNTSNNEMDVHVRASFGNISNRFISLQIRENSSGTVFVFNSNVLNPLGSTGISYADGNTITVPAGWQYRLANVGGSTDALTERWYELY